MGSSSLGTPTCPLHRDPGCWAVSPQGLHPWAGFPPFLHVDLVVPLSAGGAALRPTQALRQRVG